MPDQSRFKKIHTLPGKNGFVYKPQFGVIVIVKSEREQAALFAELKAAGHQKVKVVNV